VAKKEKKLKADIPDYWYTFNGWYGIPVRTGKTFWEKDRPWSLADYTWFSAEGFRGMTRA
jgi:hypothetical protein